MCYVRKNHLLECLITLIRDNITFTTTDIYSTINTYYTELQMVKVHINNTKHITIANIYIPPRDSTSTHYKTADTDIQHCIQHITNIPHSVLTGDESRHFYQTQVLHCFILSMKFFSIIKSVLILTLTRVIVVLILVTPQLNKNDRSQRCSCPSTTFLPKPNTHLREWCAR